MTQKALIEKVYEWFASQDFNAQSVVLGQVEAPSTGTLIDLLLASHQEDSMGTGPPESAGDVARETLARQRAARGRAPAKKRRQSASGE
jgi:hypothetical protein